MAAQKPERASQQGTASGQADATADLGRRQHAQAVAVSPGKILCGNSLV